MIPPNDDLDYKRVSQISFEIEQDANYTASRRPVDSWEISKVLTKLEQRLDRIEAHLLLIFDNDGQTKNLS